MPEVRFEDQVAVANLQGALRLAVPLDRTFLETVAAGTVTAIAAVPDVPCAVGARIDGDRLIVELMPVSHGPVPQHVTVRVSGIRRHRSGVRFPRFSANDAAANTEFWRSWVR
jgi:hypothetical protein